MITRYSLLRGRFIEDKNGGWVIHADHVHEVARAIEASEERNKRFAAEIDELRRAERRS